MSDRFQTENEQRKDFIIGKLLDGGIYKTENRQLYELSLKELENTYEKLYKTNESA
ncbi:Fur-regulated basic protein FbpA [Sporolactobacillus sp. THM7-4]|nr:Fur-regulated basic protein FbpA [Sporolactobacillus sp. THM7-4]